MAYAQHFRNAVGAVVVFDLTKAETFRNCSRWINLIKENSEPQCQIILVGNKTDLCKEETIEDRNPSQFIDPNSPQVVFTSSEG